MSLYLVRHDDVGKQGVCYGQTDLPSIHDYQQTAHTLFPHLPKQPDNIIASPLSRCSNLTKALYPSRLIFEEPAFLELNFGDWENNPWDSIPREQIDQWSNTPLCFSFPNGESIDEFRQRVTIAGKNLLHSNETNVLVTHAGVMRLMFALATEKPWQELLNLSIPMASVWLIENRTFGQINC